MKNKNGKVLVALILAIACIASISACGKGTPTGTTASTTANNPSTEDITTAEAATEEVTTEGITTEEITTEEITTEEITTEEATTEDARTEFVVELRWHLGYVGSYSNSNWADKINPTGSYYSFSEIFTVPSAGTTITFIDDNTNSNGDTNYASAAAYVFSSWKQDTSGKWVIDLDGTNLNGTVADYTSENGARIYTYTTEKDNENLRITFRSGETASFTPAAYPTMTAKGSTAPLTNVETSFGIFD